MFLLAFISLLAELISIFPGSHWEFLWSCCQRLPVYIPGNTSENKFTVSHIWHIQSCWYPGIFLLQNRVDVYLVSVVSMEIACLLLVSLPLLPHLWIALLLTSIMGVLGGIGSHGKNIWRILFFWTCAGLRSHGMDIILINTGLFMNNWYLRRNLYNIFTSVLEILLQFTCFTIIFILSQWISEQYGFTQIIP